MSDKPAVLPLASRINPGSTALLVVDVQNDFCAAEGALGQMGADVSAPQSIIPRLQLLVDVARSAGVLVVWTQLVNSELTTSRVADDQRWRSRPGTEMICQVGSWGADFYRVEPSEGEVVVQKHRYSAFVDTNLPLILRSRGIRSVVVTGVATNVCVESTARDAYMRDFHVVLVEDCCATYRPENHEATLRNIEHHFGVVVKADEVLGVWSRAGA